MSLRRELRQYRSCSPAPTRVRSPPYSEFGGALLQGNGYDEYFPRNPDLIFPAYQDRNSPPLSSPPLLPTTAGQPDIEEKTPLLEQESQPRSSSPACSPGLNKAPNKVQSPLLSDYVGIHQQLMMGQSRKSGFNRYVPRNPELLFPASQDRKNPKPSSARTELVTSQPADAEGKLPIRQELLRQQRSSSPAPSRVQSPPNSEYYRQPIVNQPQDIDYAGYPLESSPSNFSPFHQPATYPKPFSPKTQLVTSQPAGAEGKLQVRQELLRQQRNCSPAPRVQSPPNSEYYRQPVVNQPQELGYAGYSPGNSPSNFPPFHEPATYSRPYSPRFQQPIAGKPSAKEGMLLPRELCQHRSCPPGLEYLNVIDQLIVCQGGEALEVFIGFESANKYTVTNSMRQNVFYAAEKSDNSERYMFGPNRSFSMRIVDNNGQEVIHVYRPLACATCCFPCCLQNMEISAPPGTVIGSVEQDWTFITPKFSIKDDSGEIVLIIKGPTIPAASGGDVEFKEVFSKDETKIGKITKQWRGYAREAMSDADVFGINFPMNLNVKFKVLLLATCFLMDFVYFENPPALRRRR